MPEISRRRLLGGAAGVAGAAAAASLLPPNLRRAIAETPKAGSLKDIEHVVILMQENRSFDHYYGTMPGVRGFDDPKALKLSTGRSVFYQPDPKNPDGYLLPFHLDTKKTSSQAIPSTSHAWAVQHSAWNNGKMDNWLPAHRKADGDANGPYTMGYYTRDDIPFQFALAEAFTICDGYHCSLLGPTWPNRFYHWTGMIDPNGTGGGPVTSNVVPSPYTWTTYPERLTKAGVSWHVYQEEDDYGCNPLEFFKAFQDADAKSDLYKHGLAISPSDQFEWDAAHGKLPAVSWIIPTSPQCEHPDYIPASGADFVARKLEAVAANRELWQKTVFILNYDENDGLFDHVPPPVPPAGTPDEFVDGLPIGAGMRVPCTIVSPWTQGGYVASENFDHTSVLQFLERITGVQEPNISAWRRQTFGDLTSALGFPSHRPAPKLPQTKKALWQAEYDIAHLPPAQFPGADQTPPHQGKQKTSIAVSVPAALGGASKYSKSRLTENATNHRDDFPDGAMDTSFPGILASVTGAAVPATAGPLAYIPTIVSYSVAVIDTSSGKLVSSVDAGTNPYGIAAVPGGRKFYVTNSGASDVSVFSTYGPEITSSITVGLYPHGIAVAPDGRLAYVANTGPDTGPGGSRTVSAIGVTTDTVVGTIDVGLAPQTIAVTPDSKSVYVTCFDGLHIVDAGTQKVRKVLEYGRAHGVTISPDGKFAYIANSRADTVTVVDAKKHVPVAEIAVGKSPWNVAFRPDGAFAYVTNANEDTISVVDTASHKVTAKVTTEHVPTGITATADAIWVTNNASSSVQGISTSTLKVQDTVELGLSSEPSGVVII
jgi:phospholipase C